MYKEPRIYKPKKLKNILFLLLCSVFAFIGFLMITNGKLYKGWFVTFFFTLGTIVFLINLLPNASYLKLTEEGFEVRSLFKSNYTKWADVKNFRLGKIKGNNMIFFDYEDHHVRWEKGKKLARFLSGSEGAIDSTYTISSEDLLYLMNKYKNNLK